MISQHVNHLFGLFHTFMFSNKLKKKKYEIMFADACKLHDKWIIMRGYW